MITCKEDLINTYIENDFGELRDLYIKIALNYGVETCGGSNTDYLLNVHVIGVKDWGFGPQLEWIDREFKNARLITLSDLKPTPAKFVKVEESIFDLKEEFECGELYLAVGGMSEGVFFSNYKYAKINSKELLCACYSENNVYRQVEIDWRDEVKEVYDAVELPTGEQGSLYMGEDWDEQEFIKFCHLVASLTEKPEGV
ncbi:hypothetical protein NVP1263B_15 [Vibrio phage 1.263.B._10N.286.51.B1]|nr:hypothetical protein NVP1263A_15 [Vibrio phage 1.263.A._10N.286.51.B1]AUR99251.1 hypothetical protein NVP1263B_15 [Vibrio phage 1.263.B._10N.286.51.B1]